MNKAGKRRHGGKKGPRSKRERTEEAVTLVKLAAVLGEIVWAIVRDRLFRGGGPGPLL